jgi:hypothetical protein
MANLNNEKLDSSLKNNVFKFLLGTEGVGGRGRGGVGGKGGGGGRGEK